jgi:probable F420-dependent oxidoreductase
MTRFSVGVQLHPQHTNMAALREAWQRVDELEADGTRVKSLWTWDHFFPLYGDPDGPHFDGWSILAAMAVTTSHVDIGMLVTCNSYRNPQLLADMARTLDHLSDGRAILGIGSGWFERDYNEYGYEFGDAASRLRDLARDLPLIESRLAALNPPSVRQPLPILIGGGGEKVTLRLVAQHAHMWNIIGSPQDVARKNKILDDWCDKVGRNPAEIERTVALMNPSTAVAEADAYLEAGITHMIVGIADPFDLEPVRELLAASVRT